MKVSELTRCYRECVEAKTRQPVRRPSADVTADVAIASKILRWCDEHSVDPAELVKLRVEDLWQRLGRIPAFSRLCSEKFVRSAQRAEASTAAGSKQLEIFDQTVRDLTRQLPGHEQLRRRYFFAGQHVLCLENTTAGGFDPRSHYCPSCPKAAECSSRLEQKWGFNVVALRSGRFDQVPMAVRKALRGWDGGLSV